MVAMVGFSIPLCFLCGAPSVLPNGRPFHNIYVMAQRSTSYRLSSKVVMNTKRRVRASGSANSSKSSSSSSSVENPDAITIPTGQLSTPEAVDTQKEDALLLSRVNANRDNWPSSIEDDAKMAADQEEDPDIPLEQLLLGDDEDDTADIDAAILLGDDFEEDSALDGQGDFDESVSTEDDENDDDDNDDDDEDDDEKEYDIKSQINKGDIETEAAISKNKASQVSEIEQYSMDTEDDEEALDTTNKSIDLAPNGFEPIIDAEDDKDNIADLQADIGDEETDEDIRKAATILSKSGILGLPLDKEEDNGVPPVKDFILPEDTTLFNSGEFDELFEEDQKLQQNAVEETDKKDTQTADDEEFALTTDSQYGKIWDLNEDTYVTITPPGQAYAFELDEDDEEDQDMSTVRRGRQGGWSGGLASCPVASDLPVGSNQWIARRSYELISHCKPIDLFRWTRRGEKPPPLIADLYPEAIVDPTPLGKSTLNHSQPSSIEPSENETGQESDNAQVDKRVTRLELERGFRTGRSALDRSITFPSLYKFKVEGAGEGFPESLQGIVEKTLKRSVNELMFVVQPAGRYERVEFNVVVKDSREITDLFEALRNNENVKFTYG